ncbi:MAG: hypothetical protein MJ065_06215 [Oscillospiraceae bacterium]|nr:hypothetical protein [Oscillospiraceae bacterium]
MNRQNDPVMHWLSLAFPVLILFSGVLTLVTALIGSPKQYEDSKYPQVREQITRWGKTKTRIIHAVVSLLLLAFGGWLLWHWIYGATVR